MFIKDGFGVGLKQLAEAMGPILIRFYGITIGSYFLGFKTFGKYKKFLFFSPLVNTFAKYYGVFYNRKFVGYRAGYTKAEIVSALKDLVLSKLSGGERALPISAFLKCDAGEELTGFEQHVVFDYIDKNRKLLAEKILMEELNPDVVNDIEYKKFCLFPSDSTHTLCGNRPDADLKAMGIEKRTSSPKNEKTVRNSAKIDYMKRHYSGVRSLSTTDQEIADKLYDQYGFVSDEAFAKCKEELSKHESNK